MSTRTYEVTKTYTVARDTNYLCPECKNPMKLDMATGNYFCPINADEYYLDCTGPRGTMKLGVVPHAVHQGPAPFYSAAQLKSMPVEGQQVA